MRKGNVFNRLSNGYRWVLYLYVLVNVFGCMGDGKVVSNVTRNSIASNKYRGLSTTASESKEKNKLPYYSWGDKSGPVIFSDGLDSSYSVSNPPIDPLYMKNKDFSIYLKGYSGVSVPDHLDPLKSNLFNSSGNLNFNSSVDGFYKHIKNINEFMKNNKFSSQFKIENTKLDEFAWQANFLSNIDPKYGSDNSAMVIKKSLVQLMMDEAKKSNDFKRIVHIWYHSDLKNKCMMLNFIVDKNDLFILLKKIVSYKFDTNSFFNHKKDEELLEFFLYGFYYGKSMEITDSETNKKRSIQFGDPNYYIVEEFVSGSSGFNMNYLKNVRWNQNDILNALSYQKIYIFQLLADRVDKYYDIFEKAMAVFAKSTKTNEDKQKVVSSLQNAKVIEKQFQEFVGTVTTDDLFAYVNSISSSEYDKFFYFLRGKYFKDTVNYFSSDLKTSYAKYLGKLRPHYLVYLWKLHKKQSISNIDSEIMNTLKYITKQDIIDYQNYLVENNKLMYDWFECLRYVLGKNDLNTLPLFGMNYNTENNYSYKVRYELWKATDKYSSNFYIDILNNLVDNNYQIKNQTLLTFTKILSSNILENVKDIVRVYVENQGRVSDMLSGLAVGSSFLINESTKDVTGVNKVVNAVNEYSVPMLIKYYQYLNGLSKLPPHTEEYVKETIQYYIKPVHESIPKSVIDKYLENPYVYGVSKQDYENMVNDFK